MVLIQTALLRLSCSFHILVSCIVPSHNIRAILNQGHCAFYAIYTAGDDAIANNGVSEIESSIDERRTPTRIDQRLKS